MTVYEQIHSWRIRILMEIVDRLNLSSSSTVLEIGCFPPILLHQLRKKFKHVWGLASPHEPMHERRVVISNIERQELPFEMNYFDLLICSEVIEHLTVEGKKVITGLMRVLKPEGWLILTTPNINSLKRLIQRITGKESEISQPGVSIYFSHNHEYSIKELQTVIDSVSNLACREAQIISFYPPWRERVRRQSWLMQLIKWVIWLLEFLFPARRDSLLVVGQKVDTQSAI